MIACKNCGRKPDPNGPPTHWIGCPEIDRGRAQDPVEPDSADPPCEHDGCSQARKPWSGRGARPKFCAAGHKKGK